MAQLQNTGPISVSNIKSLKSGAPNSLSNLEATYMGNDGADNARPSSTGICMPQDVVVVSNVSNNTGTSAQSIANTGGFSQWNYQRTGGDPGTPVWGPHGMKEFYSAYNRRPTISLSKANTGRCNHFTLTVTIGGEFAKNASTYFLFASLNGTPSGWIGWPGNGAAAGNNASWSVTRVTGTYVYYVKDYLNCGVDGTMNASITYPGPGQTIWSGCPAPLPCNPLGGNCSPSL